MAILLRRRDFAPLHTSCAHPACQRELTGGAWFLDHDGDVRTFHTICAQETMGYPSFQEQRRHVPDLTTHDHSHRDVDAMDVIVSEGDEAPCTKSMGERRRQNALNYLALRCSTLAELPHIHPVVGADASLHEIHGSYVTRGSLIAGEISTVLDIEGTAQQASPLLARNNLMNVYTAYYQLKCKRRDIAFHRIDAMACPLPNPVAQEKRVAMLDASLSFMDSISRQLLRKLCLTPKQLFRLNLSLPVDAFPPRMVYASRSWGRGLAM
ncbi:MAG: hypothetical protein GAK28_03866 [Luteibacter sp.]|uniref:hypothetical protein n=1 Tax=Luteibacter sp. TaxID=1886636 RepID=UPI0013806CEB|nr:hypothetical protein [Luteibacter sp.]KAF1004664.1 MAG: hypothetical protein GAK28_03866 [Luteibacter sp.]